MTRALRVLAGLALFAIALFAVRLEPRFSWDDYLPPDTQDARDEARVKARFGEQTRSYLFVALDKGAETWSPDALRAARDTLRALANEPWLARLSSPFTTEVLLQDGDALRAHVPLDPLPATVEEAIALRDALAAAAPPGQRWVGRDGHALLAVLELAPGYYEDFNRAPEVWAALRARLAPLERDGFELHFAGTPALEARTALFLTREAGLFSALTLLLLALFLWLSYGSLRLAAITLGIGLASVWLLLGLLGLLGIPFTLLSIAAPVVVLVVVVSDITHVASDYLRRLADGATPREARDEAYARGRRTCFWTSVTSAAGFATFYLSSIPVIRDFALATALGILGGYAVTMLALPALLVRVEPGRPLAAATREQLLQRALAALAWLVSHHPGKVVVVFSAIALLALAGDELVRIDSTIFEELDDQTAVVRDNRYFGERFTGEMSVEVMVTLPPGESALTPRNFTLLSQLERRFAKAPDLVETAGPASLFAWAFRIYSGDASPERFSEAQLGQLALVIESFAPRLRERYLTRRQAGDGRVVEEARLDLRFSDPAARATVGLLDQVRTELSSARPDVKLAYGGRPYRAMRAFTGLTLEAARGLLWAVIVILLLMTLALRSPLRGLLSMIPNLLPLICALAIFGVLGITLKPSSILIFSVALGLAVDNTVHILRRIEELRRQRPPREAVIEALAVTTVPMVRNALVVGLGFSVLLLSDSRAISLLGGTVSFTAGVALLADLLLVPAGAILLTRRAR